MNENIEEYRKDGIIDLDKYLLSNPSEKAYPYFIDGYEENNFWLKVKRGGEEKYIYVKPAKNEYLDNNYNIDLIDAVNAIYLGENFIKLDNHRELLKQVISICKVKQIGLFRQTVKDGVLENIKIF